MPESHKQPSLREHVTIKVSKQYVAITYTMKYLLGLVYNKHVLELRASIINKLIYSNRAVNHREY